VIGARTRASTLQPVTEISAHPLQRPLGMPRKQRFKPSRKPQNQAVVSSPQVTEGKEISSEQSAGQQSPANDEQAPREIERE
jgi:hypothetical protein